MLESGHLPQPVLRLAQADDRGVPDRTPQGLQVVQRRTRIDRPEPMRVPLDPGGHGPRSQNAGRGCGTRARLSGLRAEADTRHQHDRPDGGCDNPQRCALLHDEFLPAGCVAMPHTFAARSALPHPPTGDSVTTPNAVHTARRRQPHRLTRPHPVAPPIEQGERPGRDGLVGVEDAHRLPGGVHHLDSGYQRVDSARVVAAPPRSWSASRSPASRSPSPSSGGPPESTASAGPPGRRSSQIRYSEAVAPERPVHGRRTGHRGQRCRPQGRPRKTPPRRNPRPHRDQRLTESGLFAVSSPAGRSCGRSRPAGWTGRRVPSAGR